MRLEDKTGRTSFELRILGYQFEESSGDRFDDNWLVVQITVHSGDEVFIVTEPCLLTSEVEETISWMRRIGALTAPVGDMAFIEPALSFDVTSSDENEVHFVIRLILGHTYEDSLSPHPFPLSVLRDDVDVAAAELERELGAYPVRHPV